MAELVKDQMLEDKMAKDKMVEDEVDIIRNFHPPAISNSGGAEICTGPI